MPRARYVDGQRVPECYCNLITGNQVIVPTFADSSADQRAISILRELMQRHEVVPVDASGAQLGPGGVSLHESAATGVEPPSDPVARLTENIGVR
ncbi:MAG: agmatine deiminase family protein [Pirellulaceae bacterium]